MEPKRSFSSAQEEVKYWKDKAYEYKQGWVLESYRKSRMKCMCQSRLDALADPQVQHILFKFVRAWKHRKHDADAANTDMMTPEYLRSVSV